MSTKQVVVDRFSVTSAKSFADVLSAIDAQVGHPEIKGFLSGIGTAQDDREVQRIVEAAVGPTGLMEFMRFNQGEALRKQLGPNAPNLMRLLIGNLRKEPARCVNYERNGETRSRCRFVRAGDGARGRAP